MVLGHFFEENYYNESILLEDKSVWTAFLKLSLEGLLRLNLEITGIGHRHIESVPSTFTMDPYLVFSLTIPASS